MSGARAVVFAYHDVGVRCLKTLLSGGVTVPLVVTVPDDPREHQWFASVAATAADYGLDVVAPEDAHAPRLIRRVSELQPDFVFSFYYRSMLAAPLLRAASRGALNMHGSLLRLIRLNFDLMTGFSVAPLQFFSMTGFVIALLSIVFVIYLALRRLIVGPEAEGVFTLFGIAFFLIGVALIGLGVVGEYVGRIYEQVRQRPRYTVAAVLGQDDASEPAQLPHMPAAESRPAKLAAPERVRGTAE